MKVELSKRNNLYCADLKDLPGTPPVGLGSTKHEAIAHLLYLLTQDYRLVKYINHDILEVIEIEPSQPLYAKIHLSLDCVMELKLTGEVTQEAFDRLLQFLRVTGELWGLQVERQEDING